MVMSRRGSAPNETKASARCDLLARVICAAFDGSVGIALITNPAFPVHPANLALTEKTDPARKEPATHDCSNQNVKQFPYDQRKRAIGRGGANNRVSEREEPVVQTAKQKKPAKTERAAPDELPMRLKRFPQGFIMEDERDLHRGKREDRSEE